MIDDKDPVQLSEYCLNVCEVLKTNIRARSGDGINGSIIGAFEDLERCAGQPWLSPLPCQATPGS